MATRDEEVDVERADVDLHVRDRLRSIDEHDRPDGVCRIDEHLHGSDRTERIGDI